MNKKNTKMSEILKAFEALENSKNVKKNKLFIKEKNFNKSDSKEVLMLNKLIDKNHNIREL